MSPGAPPEHSGDGGTTVLPVTDDELRALVDAIVAGDHARVAAQLAARPELARATFGTGASRQNPKPYFVDAILHYVYAVDKGGVTPLHRAVRNRCAAAVAALLAAGADPHAENNSGSTPARLARVTSGRGGSGSPAAKAQQAEIVRLLDAAGAG